MESPLGMALSFFLRPFLNVAWKVMIGKRFFNCAFKVSYSSIVISPRRNFSNASSISAQVLATCGESSVWSRRAGVHSRTSLLISFAIPNFILCLCV